MDLDVDVSQDLAPQDGRKLGQVPVYDVQF
jgi:hypothetical protein